MSNTTIVPSAENVAEQVSFSSFQTPSTAVPPATAEVAQETTAAAQSAFESLKATGAETVSNLNQTFANLTDTVSQTISAASNFVSNTASSAGATLSEGCQTVSTKTGEFATYVQEGAAGIKTRTSEAISQATSDAAEGLSQRCNAAYSTVSAYGTFAKDTVSENLQWASDKTQENAKAALANAVWLKDQAASNLDAAAQTVLTNEYVVLAKQTVSDNSLVIGQTAAGVAAFVAADAGIKLLRNEKGLDKAREAAKLISGGVVIGLSATYAATTDAEKSAITIVALAAALAKSTWAAVNKPAPVCHKAFPLKA